MCACGNRYCEYCRDQSAGTHYWPRPFEHVTTAGTNICGTPLAAAKGWICPRCDTVHAPNVSRCECKS